MHYCITDAEAVPVGAVCKRSKTKLKEWNLATDKSTPYFIIDKCPENVSSLQLMDKCIGINKTQLEDYRWVSDKETKRIYQNVHCAVCHGVMEWIPWRVRTTCKDIMKADLNQVTKILLGYLCDIINEVPDELQAHARKYQCYILDNIKGCNMNGDMAQYNDVVHAACETFNLPFYFKSMRLPIIVESYNMFCHVCTTPMSIIETKCLKRNNETTQKTGDLRFSTLIDFVSLSALSKTEGQHSTACGLDEAFDNFLVGFNNTLRRLFSKIV